MFTSQDPPTNPVQDDRAPSLNPQITNLKDSIRRFFVLVVVLVIGFVPAGSITTTRTRTIGAHIKTPSPLWQPPQSPPPPRPPDSRPPHPRKAATLTSTTPSLRSAGSPPIPRQSPPRPPAGLPPTGNGFPPAPLIVRRKK